MACRKKPRRACPVTLCVPAWMDAPLMVAMSAFRVTEVTLAAGVVTDLVSEWPERFGLKVLPGSGGVGDVTIFPPGTSDTGPGVVTHTAGEISFDGFSWGSLVPGKWRARSAGGATVQVIELYLLNRRGRYDPARYCSTAKATGAANAVVGGRDDNGNTGRRGRPPGSH